MAAALEEKADTEVKGGFGSVDRGAKPVKKEMPRHSGWHDIPIDGGGDPDSAEYDLEVPEVPQKTGTDYKDLL